MNVQYEKQGDYFIPCIRTKEQKELHLGVWANRHRRYLKEHHKVRYYNLLTSEKLHDYLADIDEQAENMFSRLVNELAEKEAITEALKAENVSELLTRLGTVGKTEINKVYDPACGSGSLLLKAEKVLGKEAIRNGFYGQEINITTYNLCRINMFLHDVGFDKFDMQCRAQTSKYKRINRQKEQHKKQLLCRYWVR